jgi:hypothetical protein
MGNLVGLILECTTGTSGLDCCDALGIAQAAISNFADRTTFIPKGFS